MRVIPANQFDLIDLINSNPNHVLLLLLRHISRLETLSKNKLVCHKDLMDYPSVFYLPDPRGAA